MRDIEYEAELACLRNRRWTAITWDRDVETIADRMDEIAGRLSP